MSENPEENLDHLEDDEMATTHSTFVHLFAGGCGGTAGAVVTCPLEVVKTRLQASVPTFRPLVVQPAGLVYVNGVASLPVTVVRPSGIFTCLRQMIKTEGFRSLFKGLGPNLVGVAPARAVYFSIYANTKRFLNRSGSFIPESSIVHIMSGCAAGFTTSSITCPVWVVKTRLQLDSRISKLSIPECILQVYNSEGLRGFYRGLTASYAGISETVINFVIYERIKSILKSSPHRDPNDRSIKHFAEFMLAAATSKSMASTIAYPHEVVRTRLRQPEVDGKKRYHTFFQTLFKIMREEGRPGLYAGLTTHLLRQIPNTAIMFVTYEAIVSFMSDDM